jgi:hypothetical protein
LTDPLTLFLAGDTALVIQQAKGIFTAMTEYDGELDFKDAAKKALERIAKWERDCGETLATYKAFQEAPGNAQCAAPPVF